MPLTPGTRLGPYEIIAPLGAGGMGEVYRATDPRLGRDVAIKALPPEFSRDPDRLTRFEREARLLASLSHTNIAGIHGIEEVDDARYLVLEFVPGETLAARLARGLVGNLPETEMSVRIWSYSPASGRLSLSRPSYAMRELITAEAQRTRRRRRGVSPRFLCGLCASAVKTVSYLGIRDLSASASTAVG